MKQMAVLGMAACLASVTTAAQADAGDPYQFSLVSGSSAVGQTLIRTATATGQSILCHGTSPCIAIADAKPAGAGSYRLTSWAFFQPADANRVWNIVRYDVKSGRIWTLAYDGKTTASWTEFTYP